MPDPDKENDKNKKEKKEKDTLTCDFPDTTKKMYDRDDGNFYCEEEK